MEFDTGRAGGFEPLRFVAKGKTVVLGLITTKEPKLEPEDELLRRIDQASKYVPTEISPSARNAASPRPLRESAFLGRHAPQARTGHQGRAESLGMTEFHGSFKWFKQFKPFKTLKGLNILNGLGDRNAVP